MARGIIALEEYTDSSDPNELDFSTFESVISTEIDDVIDGTEMVTDTVEYCQVHSDITNIIATEGYGNRPEIARIALASIEKRLFGKPMVATRVGTESRTRIAIEGKNVFVRAWQAIVKFFKKLWSKMKAFFGGGGGGGDKGKTKKKKKEIENTSVDEVKKDLQKIESSDITQGSESKASKVLEMMKKEPYLYGIVNGRDVMGPSQMLEYVLDIKDIVEDLSDEFTDAEADIKDLIEVYKKSHKKELSANFDYDEMIKENAKFSDGILSAVEGLAKTLLPNFSFIEINRETHTFSIVKHHHANELMENAGFDWLKNELMILLEHKDKIAKSFDKLATLNDAVEKYGTKVNELNSYVNKEQASIGNIDDASPMLSKVQSVILSMTRMSVKLLSVFVGIVALQSRYVDAVHRVIMAASDKGK